MEGRLPITSLFGSSAIFDLASESSEPVSVGCP